MESIRAHAAITCAVVRVARSVSAQDARATWSKLRFYGTVLENAVEFVRESVRYKLILMRIYLTNISCTKLKYLQQQ